MGVTALVLLSTLLVSCGTVQPTLGSPLSPAVKLAMAPVPAAPVADPGPHFPLVLGQTWQYTNVGSLNRGSTRTDAIVQLLERPSRLGTGMMTVVEIERTETGKARQRFTIEVYDNGLARSYDPSLPKLGMPILSAPSAKPQEWGYNPNHGQTGYLGILQWPNTTSVTIGSQTYAGCLKVTMTSSGHGFGNFRRETVWAPGIGPVRIVEGDPARAHRVYELAAVTAP
jgi:hypothetical protein